MAEAPARTQTVHVLWEPAEGQPSCDVVFFHGLQIGSYETAWEHTWKNQQGMLWPAEWLGQQDFPTARILSISYDSEAIRGGKTMDEVARDLVYQVCMLAKVGQDRPVVLVGHSLGGLVLKKLAMEAHKEAGLQDSLLSPCCKAFCNNLAGTFYYATPHGGAVLGSLADSVFKGPVLDYLTVFSRHGAELNRDFMLAFPTLRFMALVETQKYKPLGRLFPGVKVVKEGSAMQGMHNYVEVGEDHSSICKPPSTEANTCRFLKEYLQQALDNDKRRGQERQSIQQQALQLSTLTQLELSKQVLTLNKRYSDEVGPALAWIKLKREQLLPELGERWAEALYPPDKRSRELEVTPHRRVLRDFWRDVQELCGQQLLDDSFFKKNNMAGRAREYRLLVEPTEIANYYHGNMHLPNTRGQGGHYIDGITLELSDDNSRRPGRFIFLQQVEQRVFAERDPAYTTASSLGLARLLKELVGSRTWKEYKEQPEGPQQQDTLQQHDQA